MTKQEIIKKVKELMITSDSRLADPEYRKTMPSWEKVGLVRKMLVVATKMEMFN